ncbi:4-(cytidine 5'-diphospho)-2-C-methyl-D-erythritol kinase [Corynebacterium sp. CCM 8862]|uniref:4-diphosphocytidyl-2-C-methyl-D-erythritol kinase n=2 Tax=Corynebacterium mendelii TaxID=2765362 RepID=A0A939IVY8_9CORY|nr:4-(cytidine 5'-diphospho)-2-C-methyl-D-erythritol kinase [Corynebacterium mendelii]
MFPGAGRFSVVELDAHAKINLLLGVGAARSDGYHELNSVFQTLDLSDRVRVTAHDPRDHPAPADPATAVHSLSVTGLGARHVPTDSTNLAWKAIDLVVAEYRRRGVTSFPVFEVSIVKGIPTAGGMAGGSADAAAAVAGAEALLRDRGGPLDEATVLRICLELGSDVPFSYLGKTRLGTGRGEKLTPMLCRGTYHWVVALQRTGLSTPEVFARFDQLVAEGRGPSTPADPQGVARALASGDPLQLAGVLRNDLSAAALSLMPKLHSTLAAGTRAGAVAGMVSGSGPTCVFLCRNAQQAEDVAEEIIDSGKASTAVTATGPAPGVIAVNSPLPGR